MSHELVGVILEIDGNMAKVGLRNRLDLGDTIEYLTPGIEEELFMIESMKDEERMNINSARNEDIIFIQVPKKVRENDLIRRKKDFSSVHHKVIQSIGERQ
jgi:hypothetical protein